MRFIIANQSFVFQGKKFKWQSSTMTLLPHLALLLSTPTSILDKTLHICSYRVWVFVDCCIVQDKASWRSCEMRQDGLWSLYQKQRNRTRNDNKPREQHNKWDKETNATTHTCELATVLLLIVVCKHHRECERRRECRHGVVITCACLHVQTSTIIIYTYMNKRNCWFYSLTERW